MVNNNLIENMFELVHQLKRKRQELIEQSQLSMVPMEVRVLKIIAKKPNCTAADIVLWLNRDKAQITRLLQTLSKNKLIVKSANPQDKRSQSLMLSIKGQEKISKIKGIDEQIYQQMQEGLEIKELKLAAKILEKMGQNLS